MSEAIDKALYELWEAATFEGHPRLREAAAENALDAVREAITAALRVPRAVFPAVELYLEEADPSDSDTQELRAWYNALPE